MPRPLTACLVLITLLGGCSPKPRAHDGTPPLSGEGGVYQVENLHELDGLGLFGVEVVLADIDADSFPDLVMSSGDVSSPQPLVLYRNTRKKRPFLDRPSWYSGNIAHRGALAVGDIDANGRPDLVVPVLYDNSARPDSGSLEVFLTDAAGDLPALPSYVLPMPDVPFSVALGDVDGDGDVDAVVASVHAIHGSIGTPTTQRVYFNRAGKLHTEQPWLGPSLAAVSALLTDLDQDGWLDLVIGGDRVAVVHGGENTFSSDWALNTSWLDAPFNAAFGITAGKIGTNPAHSVVIADNCRKSNGMCDRNALWLFEPDHKGLPAKTGRVLRDLENGSHVRIFDGNNDGNTDLVVTQLGRQERGAPALLLQGDPGGTTFSAQFSTEPFPGEGIAIGDPLRTTTEETFTVIDLQDPIVTLPRQHIADVRRVRVDDVELGRDRFSWIPGTNWVSVAALPARASKLEITYTSSRRHTLILASHDPRFGPKLMFSDYAERGGLSTASVSH